MSSDPRRAVRCAIYTRKSSEEGLEKSFNSLDAQREACQSFIAANGKKDGSAFPTLRRRRIFGRKHGATSASRIVGRR